MLKNQKMEVMPRKRHVSRNLDPVIDLLYLIVMPRKRHVSRNCIT